MPREKIYYDSSAGPLWISVAVEGLVEWEFEYHKGNQPILARWDDPKPTPTGGDHHTFEIEKPPPPGTLATRWAVVLTNRSNEEQPYKVAIKWPQDGAVLHTVVREGTLAPGESVRLDGEPWLLARNN